jgi:hypothetical protein
MAEQRDPPDWNSDPCNLIRDTQFSSLPASLRLRQAPDRLRVGLPNLRLPCIGIHSLLNRHRFDWFTIDWRHQLATRSARPGISRSRQSRTVRLPTRLGPVAPGIQGVVRPVPIPTQIFHHSATPKPGIRATLQGPRPWQMRSGAASASEQQPLHPGWKRSGGAETREGCRLPASFLPHLVLPVYHARTVFLRS